MHGFGGRNEEHFDTDVGVSASSSRQFLSDVIFEQHSYLNVDSYLLISFPISWIANMQY